MKKLIFLLLILSNFIILNECNADIKTVPKKIIFTEWLKQSTLKYGMLISFCTAQSLTGLVESSKFNGNHIVKEDDYHIYRTGQDIAFLGTGWFMYANVQNKKVSWWIKGRRILGSALLARNAFEWSYKANKWGNPFDYDPNHSNNKKAIVYFKWDGNKGRFVDAYISGVGGQGVAIDLLFTILGILIFK